MEDRTLDPAELFEFLIGTLCGVVELVGARHGLSAAVIGRIWRRVRRLGDRFARLVERIRAGGFCDAMPARGRAAAVRPEGAAEVRWKRLPGAIRRYVGWLVHLLHETEASKGTMYWILARPEVKELIAEAPLHFGQILRPLCRMLGVEVPIAVLLAERERKATVVAEAEVEPEAAAPVAVAPVAVAPEPERKDDDAVDERSADSGCWPGWPGPCVVPRTHEEFWNFDPGKSAGPKNRD